MTEFLFQPNFHENDDTVAGSKNVISADIENIGQRDHLQKSLYLSLVLYD